ncbi:transcriptional regulator [Rothia kristinae]|uniref:transcriptional regulator n=1 Tax=Rothia kristinae TaxID=37923 RepID=UPI0011A007CB|nr:transcriptional regulator [Rothia kristinae]
MTEQRIRFRDLKHYETVEDLDELTGPAHGTVTLPVSVFWSGVTRTFDLDNPSHRAQVYSSVLTNGYGPQMREFVNRDRFIEDWSRLRLDQRIVDLWTSRHPVLAGIEREW